MGWIFDGMVVDGSNLFDRNGNFYFLTRQDNIMKIFWYFYYTSLYFWFLFLYFVLFLWCDSRIFLYYFSFYFILFSFHFLLISWTIKRCFVKMYKNFGVTFNASVDLIFCDFYKSEKEVKWFILLSTFVKWGSLFASNKI